MLNRRKRRLENVIENSNTLHIYHDKASVEFIIINEEKFCLCSAKEDLILTFSRYDKQIIYHEL